MWRTADGVLHTVALPEPAHAFTSSALVAVLTVLDGLPVTIREQVLQSMAMDAVALWEDQASPIDEAEEQRFHAVAVPREVFTAEPVDRTALQQALARVHPRWQLDVALALEDLTDDQDGNDDEEDDGGQGDGAARDLPATDNVGGHR